MSEGMNDSGGYYRRNLKLTVAYDGTRFHGFQRQAGHKLPTVQEALEEAWRRLTGEAVKATGAGRTDAGVHALGQVVNIRTQVASIPAERVPYAFNSVLPKDVAVLECVEVPLAFHARFDARWKRYEYRVLNRAFPSPVERLYTYHVSHPLDVEAMQEGARLLLGTHDFSAFSGSEAKGRSPVRTVSRCDVWRDGEKVHFAVEGDGFLYRMVRTIVGTLLQVGLGKKEPGWVGEVLASRDRAEAGPTVPACGLYLVEVGY